MCIGKLEKGLILLPAKLFIPFPDKLNKFNK